MCITILFRFVQSDGIEKFRFEKQNVKRPLHLASSGKITTKVQQKVCVWNQRVWKEPLQTKLSNIWSRTSLIWTSYFQPNQAHSLAVWMPLSLDGLVHKGHVADSARVYNASCSCFVSDLHRVHSLQRHSLQRKYSETLVRTKHQNKAVFWHSLRIPFSRIWESLRAQKSWRFLFLCWWQWICFFADGNEYETLVCV